ncbi:hypothetical protein Glove_230g217 [Diversispora epigaea]|uniref:F-box domain-containing protein n=1 Tax=Diversispora epigaea TaxID=1348612 RepID=A0A397ICY4_9GLOM|nr:hypothetical protein Glove_230g217 [Diversispora epigaea]
MIRNFQDSSLVNFDISFALYVLIYLILSSPTFELARGCSKLQNLEISWDGDIIDRSIYEIVRLCHSLRHLGIGGDKNCSYPDLRKLNLSECDKVTDIGVRQIAQYHNLEHLKLNSLEFLDDKTICIIVQSYPNICYLDLKFCHVTDTSVEAIANSCRDYTCLQN